MSPPRRVLGHRQSPGRADDAQPTGVRRLDSLLDAAFHEIALAAGNSRAVLATLARALIDLAARTSSTEQREAVGRQIDIARRSAERGLADPADRTAVIEAFAGVRTIIAARSSP